MEELLLTVIQGLSGPGAAFILLAVVLFFVWKLINRVLNMASTHLTNIEGKFDKLNDIIEKHGERLEDRLETMNDNVIRLDRHLLLAPRETLQTHKN